MKQMLEFNNYFYPAIVIEHVRNGEHILRDLQYKLTHSNAPKGAQQMSEQSL